MDATLHSLARLALVVTVVASPASRGAGAEETFSGRLLLTLFFVVMTLGRGPAPGVEAAGGKARIGGRAVSFDGEAIEIE